eukprot:scaffold220950_cov17-Tisochrysis_lutea.AAC.1
MIDAEGVETSLPYQLTVYALGVGWLRLVFVFPICHSTQAQPSKPPNISPLAAAASFLLSVTIVDG